MAQAANMVHCQLWMGGLESYMTESFILASFQRMGEKPLNVKVMRNKFSGEPAGYCFVHFENDDEAIDAMHKLNGKIIPNTNPPVRFRLNTASNQGKIVMNDREFSLWVGDLSQEVDDYTLYKCFAAKYQSIKAAKVILDASGYSKGFGFLRFGLEDEQKHCLAHMNGYKGLGSKPLKISNAIPKSQRGPNSNGPQMPQQSGGYQYPPDYSNYYDPNNYWQHYGQWGAGYGYDPNTGNYQYDPSYGAQYGNQYPGQYNQYPPPSNQYPQQNYPYTHPPYPYYPPQAPAAPAPTTAPPAAPPVATLAPVDDSNEVVEHSPPVDVEKENREYSDAILNFWVDLASHAGLSQEIFEDETDKLNMMEVSLPAVTVNLENKELAKLAVEAQDLKHSNYCQSESGESSSSVSREGSVESEVKKRRQSTEDEEDSKEDVKRDFREEVIVKKEDGDEAEMDIKTEVLCEGEEEHKNLGGVKKEVENTAAAVVKEENTDAEQKLTSDDDVKNEVDDHEGKEVTSEKWSKVMEFMSDVDVDIMMNETETVSSESSTEGGSDSESEKVNRKRKVSENGSDAETKRLKKIADLEDMGKMDSDEDEVTHDRAMEVDSASNPIATEEDKAGSSIATVDTKPTENPSPKDVEQEINEQERSEDVCKENQEEMTEEIVEPNEIITIEEIVDAPEVPVIDAEPIVEEDSLDEEPLSSRLGESKGPSSDEGEATDRLSGAVAQDNEPLTNSKKGGQVVSDDSNSSDSSAAQDSSKEAACDESDTNNDNDLSKLLNGGQVDEEDSNQDGGPGSQHQSDNESDGTVELEDSDSS